MPRSATPLPLTIRLAIVTRPSTTAAGTTAASGCGTTQLTTTAQYDRGYGKVTDAFDLHGEHTTAVYDGFGRTVVIYAPRPGDPTTTGPLPHVYIAYDLPTDDRARPYTSVYTFTLDGIDDNTYEYKEAWSIADGLGRSIVTFAEADLAGGDGGTLLAQGLNVYDAKGNVIRAYEPFFFSGNPLAMNLGDTPPSPSIRMRCGACTNIKKLIIRISYRWEENVRRFPP